MNIEDLRMEWNRLETGVDQLRDAALLAHAQPRDREATTAGATAARRSQLASYARSSFCP